MRRILINTRMPSKIMTVYPAWTSGLPPCCWESRRTSVEKTSDDQGSPPRDFLCRILIKFLLNGCELLILELPMILYITQSFSVNLCLWMLSLQFLTVYNIMLNTKTYYSKICNIPCLPHIQCTFCWIYRWGKSCSCLCYVSGFGWRVHSRSVGKCYIERKKR